MNQPAPVEWNPNPMAAPQAAPVAAPLAPEGFAMPVEFAPPADPAAALDVTAPLMPVAPTPLAPAAPAVATHAVATHADHPTSLAMPQAPEGPAHDAMPTFAAAMDAAPAATPAEAMAAAMAMPVADPAAPADVDPTRAWWSPANALVLAVLALAWQFSSFYARVQLPLVEGTGSQLTYFDRIVGGLPLIDSGMFGPAIGLLLGVGALVMVLASTRAGLREPVLQGAIGAIAGLALICTPLLPVIAG